MTVEQALERTPLVNELAEATTALRKLEREHAALLQSIERGEIGGVWRPTHNFTHTHTHTPTHTHTHTHTHTYTHSLTHSLARAHMSSHIHARVFCYHSWSRT
jgi:hypothetical protein